MSHILVVEDDTSLSDYIREWEGKGHLVDRALTAAQGLACLLDAQRKYDVVVLDVKLPLSIGEGMPVPDDLEVADGGWWVLDELRRRSGPNRDVWVVVVSAYFHRQTEAYAHVRRDERCTRVEKADDPDLIKEAMEPFLI